MLTRKITYTDLNDEQVTDTAYFNLSKVDLIEMQVDTKGGVRGVMEQLVKERDEKKMFEWFKKFILKSYGEKSEDGKRFIRSEELSQRFSESLAFDQLIYEMLSDEDAAADFLIGILPKEVTGNVDTAAMKKEAKEAVAALEAAETKTDEPAQEEAPKVLEGPPRPPTS